MKNFFAVSACVLLIAAKAGQGFLTEEVKIVRHVETTHKIVALTFDDGPNVKTTPELLDVLKQKQVKATFFILGENAALHPEIVARAVKEGHEIASHAYTHKHLTKMSQKDCAEELDRAEETIMSVAPKPHYFRPPGGLYNEGVIEEANKRGYTTVLWSVDPLDWQRPSVAQVISRVKSKVTPGGVVLMHDGLYPLPTPKAVSALIDDLRADGYEFVTMDELLRYEEVRQTGLF